MSISHAFQLVPFYPCASVTDLSGIFSLKDSFIRIQITQRGDTNQTHWPIHPPERTKGLWEDTCYEFFLGRINQPDYLEVNLSPAGAWNSFAFTDVRTDMRETDMMILSSWEYRCSSKQAQFSAELQHHLPPGNYQLGISTVIKETTGKRYYFALQHEGIQPDFHDRRGWRIQLPLTEQT